MNGFKLLAIVPLEGCNRKFSKNLKTGIPYNFYKDYEIHLNSEKTDVTQVLNKNTKDFNQLYNLQNGIQVNISAVVGINGSGKSTLIELLYYFIYATCVQLKHNGDNILQRYSDLLASELIKLQSDIKDLRETDDLFKVISLQNKYGLTVNHYDTSKYKQTVASLLESRHDQRYLQQKEAENLDRLIEKELKVAIVFETKKGILCARYYDSSLKINCLSDNLKLESEYQLDHLFYSICLNFSHHSLNSDTLGQWINNLFHKNDAYTTPVVISPMRNKGIVDINKELHLSNERLMSNLAYDIAQQKEYRLLNKYKISKFHFNVKNGISPYPLSYGRGIYDLSSASLLKKHLGINSFSDYRPFHDYAIRYLENKIPKIKDQYEQLFINENGTYDEERFNKFIQNDQSHITKKVRQTINFLKATYNSTSALWNNKKNQPYIELSISGFKTWLALCDKNYRNCTPAQLMEFALPGFFNVDYELMAENGDTIKLSELSSGEQQMILNINTITYHLYNLQSVFKNKKSNADRVSYNNVAVFLDEIELYYHPEMQQKLVGNILDAMKLIKSKGEKGIESINLCFLTHSPFILSDIPNSNILQLNVNKNGESEVVDSNNETFGANINDLLAGSFFLDKTLIGAFAENKINNLIDKINKRQRFNERDNILLKKIGDTFLKSSIEYSILERNDKNIS